MTKYILIADEWDGNVTAYFNAKGFLVEFAISSWSIKEEDHKYLLSNIGYMLTDVMLKDFAIANGYKYRAARIDLSFERFWRMYGNARNKIGAKKLWEKLNERDRYYVLVNLKGYIRFCKRNPTYTQMYPDTYLLGHTTDDWDKVPDWFVKPVKS